MSVDLAPRFSEREWLDDPGFEIWTNGTTPTFWTPTGVVTVAQETTEKFAGANSCKATRSDGATFGSVVSREFNLTFNAWFYIGMRAKGTVAISSAVRLLFRNIRTGLSWDEAAQAWIASGSVYRDSITFDYALAGAWIQIDGRNHLPTDTFRMDLAGYWTAAESLFYDAATLFGPFAKPIAQVGLAPLTYHGEGFRRGAFH